MLEEAILLGAAIGAAFGLTGRAFRLQASRRRWRSIHQLLEDQQPEEYLDRVEQELKHVRRPLHRQLLNANKAAAYVYLGRFEEAWGTLKDIPVAHLPGRWKHSYYHNLLVTLIFQRRFEEARKLMNEQHELFDNPPAPLKVHMDTSRAMYEWYVGDQQRARAMLADLAQAERPVVYKVGVFYHLGLAAQADGNTDAARRYFSQSAEAAPNHWAGLQARQRLTELR